MHAIPRLHSGEGGDLLIHTLQLRIATVVHDWSVGRGLGMQDLRRRGLRQLSAGGEDPRDCANGAVQLGSDRANGSRPRSATAPLTARSPS
jgi:hypothetical protein